ncbi:MAG: hypothetical protein ACR2QJ_03110 [Geminicoccaceae bacterium]
MLWVMDSATAKMADLASRIRHAQSYPFARPACSFLFEGGIMQPLRRDSCLGRTAVIAAGSNASPARLAAKFGDGASIPVERAELDGFTVVFAGHFTAYGAMPATLCPHPGARTTVWITWLTPEQLSIMHRSEGVIGCCEAAQRYDYAALDGLDLRLDSARSIDKAGAYLSRRMFAPQARPIRLAEVSSERCTFRAASHPSVLREAAGHLDPETGFGDFMTEVFAGIDQRQALFERLTPFTIEREKAWPGGMLSMPSIVD